MQEKVQKLLDEGWLLHGGVSIGHGGTSGYMESAYAQAMVRGKPSKKERDGVDELAKDLSTPRPKS